MCGERDVAATAKLDSVPGTVGNLSIAHVLTGRLADLY
jgi:hypothetical protein